MEAAHVSARSSTRLSKVTRFVVAVMLLATFAASAGTASSHEGSHAVVGSGPASFVHFGPNGSYAEKKAALSIAAVGSSGVVTIGGASYQIRCAVNEGNPPYVHLLLFSTAPSLEGLSLRVVLAIFDRPFNGYPKGTAFAAVIERRGTQGSGPCKYYGPGEGLEKDRKSSNRFHHVP